MRLALVALNKTLRECKVLHTRSSFCPRGLYQNIPWIGS